MAWYDYDETLVGVPPGQQPIRAVDAAVAVTHVDTGAVLAVRQGGADVSTVVTADGRATFQTTEPVCRVTALGESRTVMSSQAKIAVFPAGDTSVATLVNNPTSQTGAALSGTYEPLGAVAPVAADASQALLLAQGATYVDTALPLSAQVTFTKVGALFDTTDTGVDFPTIYWPWVLRVDTLIGAPLGAYYMWFSTDHGGVNGKIGLAYADDIAGPWTIHGEVYQDTVSGIETETPSVVWDYAAAEFVMFYHQGPVTGGVAGQVTLYATSPDGITWTRQGIAVDVHSGSDFPGSQHTGYLRPSRVGDRWLGYGLLIGTDSPRYALAYSTNGRDDWEIDSRPLGFGAEWLPSTKQISWNLGSVVLWRGQWVWIGIVNPFVSGGSIADGELCIAPLADDFRSLTGPPVKVLADDTLGWESGNITGSCVLVDQGRLWVIYRSGDGDTLPLTFGAAYAEAI